MKGPHAITSSKPSHRGDAWALFVLIGVPLCITLIYLPYYLMPRGQRLRNALHPLLRPSAGVGLALGIVGLSLFLFMWLYPLRKHARWLSRAGSLAGWLRVHVVVGLSLPLLLAVHAGWRFDGLIGLGYLSMLIVCASGAIGRYLYVRIPRSRSGVEMSFDEVAGERRALLTRIAASTGLEPAAVERALAIDPRPYRGLDPLRTIARMIRDDWARARALRDLRQSWHSARPGGRRLDPKVLTETLRLARQEMALAQQLRMLDATRTLFGYWHVAHRPFAITALLAVLVHVAVALWIGGVGLRPH